MRKRAWPRRRTTKLRGTILVDSLVGVTILAIAAAAFFSFFPVVHKTHVLGADEAKATQMAQKMLEHVQLMSPSTLTASTLTTLGLIDTGQTEAPYSFDKVPLDDWTKYSPATALRNGKGLMEVSNISDGSVKVKVTVSWKSESGVNRSITLGTILGGHRQ